MSQERFAELAGVSKETIGRLEQAVGSPSLETLDKVALVLDTTVPILLAKRACDEVAVLVAELPDREQEIARVMIKALSEHVRSAEPAP
ncbi:hypothetical protein PPSIR1_21044 [Plesiocystis pacifica SIR-1]|uniref:HTH cro/C1-type domain-containing protein n=1 Tax=Plesiocystis pacifica SIR-1 TaxID=391625 RepID=A6G3E8_9BACT|nr:hypothetical protein PPSIR1_21044 [Plesiocystis pacifica SIR-1]